MDEPVASLDNGSEYYELAEDTTASKTATDENASVAGLTTKVFTRKHILNTPDTEGEELSYTVNVASTVDVTPATMDSEDKTADLTFYTVRYNTVSDTNNTNRVLRTYYVRSGDLVPQYKSAALSGYTFDRWSETQWTSENKVGGVAFDFTTKITRNIDLYANYATPTVTIGDIIYTNASGTAGAASNYYRMGNLTISGFDAGEKSIKYVFITLTHTSSIKFTNLTSNMNIYKGSSTSAASKSNNAVTLSGQSDLEGETIRIEFATPVSMATAQDYIRNNVIVQPVADNKEHTIKVEVADANASFEAANVVNASKNSVSGAIDLANKATTNGGVTLSSGVYYLIKNCTFGSLSSTTYGLKIAENATVFIYIPAGVTLTCYGGSGNSGSNDKGHSGINLVDSATLVLLGQGTVVAQGGSAQNGKNGGNGGSASGKTSGAGGNGGNGGGGAGAGIGRDGGKGGDGGSGGASITYSGSGENVNGKAGSVGSNGTSSTTTMGLLYVNGVTVNANGGAAGTGGSGGSAGNAYSNHDGGRLRPVGAGGGGGGYGGGNGSGGKACTTANNGNTEGWDDPGAWYATSKSTKTATAGSTGSGGQGAAGQAKNQKNGNTSVTESYRDSSGGAGGNGGGSASAKANTDLSGTNRKSYTASIANSNSTLRKSYNISYKVIRDTGSVSKSRSYTTSYNAGVGTTITFPNYDDTDANVIFLGWQVSSYPLNTTSTSTTFGSAANRAKRYAEGETLYLDPSVLGNLTFTAVTQRVGGIKANDTKTGIKVSSSASSTKQTYYTYNIYLKTDGAATAKGNLTVNSVSVAPGSDENRTYTLTSTTNLAGQSILLNGSPIGTIAALSDTTSLTTINYETVQVTVTGKTPGSVQLVKADGNSVEAPSLISQESAGGAGNDGSASDSSGGSNGSTTGVTYSAERLTSENKGQFNIFVDGEDITAATEQTACYGSPVTVNFPTVTVKIASSGVTADQISSVELRQNSGEGTTLFLTKQADGSFTYTKLVDASTTYTVYVNGEATSTNDVTFSASKTVEASYNRWITDVITRIDGEKADLGDVKLIVGEGEEATEEELIRTGVGTYELTTTESKSGKLTVDGEVVKSSFTTGSTTTIDYYTITYAKSGESDYAETEDGEVPVDETIYLSGEKVTLFGNIGLATALTEEDEINPLTNVGRTFVGWSINGKTYQAGETFAISSKTTAKAVWARTDLSAATVTLSQNSFTYDGEAQTPDVTVALNGKTLTKGTDYTITYQNTNKDAGRDDASGSDLNAINAGTVTMTITGVGAYEGTKEVSYTIAKKALTADGIQAKNRDYDGTTVIDLDLDNVRLTGKVADDDVSLNLNAKASVYTPDARDNKDVILDASNLTGAAASNYELETPSAVTVTITPKELTAEMFTVADGNVYTGLALTPKVTGTDSQLVDSVATNILSDSDFVLSYKENVHAGTATVTISARQYQEVSGEDTGDDLGSSGDAGSDAGAVEEDTGDDPTEEAPEGEGDDEETEEKLVPYENNYKGTVTKTFTIAKAKVTVTAKAATSVYGEAVADVTSNYEAKATSGALYEADLAALGFCGKTSVKTGYAVGKYTDAVTVAYKEHADYEITTVAADYTVTKADVLKTVATGYTGVYDGSAHGVSVKVYPLDASDTKYTIYYSHGTELTVSNYQTAGKTEAPTVTNAGESTVYYYVISDNYADVSGQASVKISKAPLTVTVGKGSITYGEDVTGVTFEEEGADNANGVDLTGVTVSGLVNGETASDVLSGSLSFTSNYVQYGDVGTYSLTGTGLTSTNYAINYVPGTLTVEKKAVKFTWVGAGGTALGDAPSFTYTGVAQGIYAKVAEESIVNNDDVTVGGYASATAKDGTKYEQTATNVGEYVAKVNRITGSKAGNYTFESTETTAEKSFSITMAGNAWILAPAINGETSEDGAEVTLENGIPVIASAAAKFGEVSFAYSSNIVDSESGSSEGGQEGQEGTDPEEGDQEDKEGTNPDDGGNDNSEEIDPTTLSYTSTTAPTEAGTYYMKASVPVDTAGNYGVAGENGDVTAGELVGYVKFIIKAAEDPSEPGETEKPVIYVGIEDSTINYGDTISNVNYTFQVRDSEDATGSTYKSLSEALTDEQRTALGLDDTSLETLKGKFGYSTTYQHGNALQGKVGTYTLLPKLSSDATLDDNAKYTIVFVPGTLTVSKKKIALTWPTGEDAKLAYTGEAQTVTASITDEASAVLTSDSIAVGSYTVTTDDGQATDGKDVGTYKVSATSLIGTGAGNYELDSETATATFSIVQTANSFTQTPSIAGWTYGEMAATASAKAKYGEVKFKFKKLNDADEDVNWTEYNSTESGKYPTEVGSYTLRAYVDAGTNYEGLTTVASADGESGSAGGAEGSSAGGAVGGAQGASGQVVTDVTFTIAQAEIVITAKNQTSAYGADLNDLTKKDAYEIKTITGAISESDATALGITLKTDATKSSAIGTYAITTSITKENPNIKVTCENATYTITAASTLKAAWTAANVTYDGKAHAGALGITLDGASVSEEDLANGKVEVYYSTSGALDATNYGSGARTMPTFTNAGTYTVSYYVTAKNYQPVAGSGTVTIAKKVVTVTANDANITYGEAAKNAGVTYSGFCGSDTAEKLGVSVTYNYTATKAGNGQSVGDAYAIGSNAGEYSITPVIANASEIQDYSFTAQNATLHVAKKALTASMFTLSAEGADGVETTGTGSSSLVAFTYDATAKKPGVSGTDSITLDGATPASKELLTTSDFKAETKNNTNASTASDADTLAEGADVDSAAQVVISATTDGNYTGSVTKYFTIKPRAVTLTAKAASSVYNAALAELNYDVTVNGKAIDVATVKTALKTKATTTVRKGYAVGTYADAISVDYDKTNANYSVNVVNASYTVTNAALTVIADGYTGTYDGAAHGPQITAKGTNDSDVITIYYSTSEQLESGDSLTAETYVALAAAGKASTEVPKFTDAGSYTVFYLAMSGNYTPVAGNVTVVIKKAALTIQPKTLSLIYGEDLATVLPSLSVEDLTATGLKGTDTIAGAKTEGSLTFMSPYKQYDDAGTYVVTVSGFDAKNYDVTALSGKLNVAKKEVGISWPEDGTLTYNGSTQGVAAKLTGIVNNDAVNAVYENNASENTLASATNVGSYTAKVSGLGGAKAGNYTLANDAVREFTWSIEKAENSWTIEPDISDYAASEDGSKNATAYAAAAFGTVKFSYSSDENESFTETQPRTEGAYYLKATVVGTENYEGIEKIISFQVTASGSGAGGAGGSGEITTVTITPNVTKNLTYGDALALTAKDHTVTESDYTVTGLPDGKTLADAVADVNALTFVSNYTVGSAVGDYLVVPKGLTANEGYAIVYAPATVSVSAKEISLTWSSDSLVYNGEEQIVTAQVGSGILEGDSLEIAGYVAPTDDNDNMRNFATNVGTYKAKVTEISGTGSSNYTVAEASMSHEWTITKAGAGAGEGNAFLTQPSIAGWTYGETASTPIGSAKFGTVVFTYASSEDGTYTSEKPTDAGTYYMKASVAETENYAELVSNPISFTIAKADLVITADDQESGLGENLASLTYQTNLTLTSAQSTALNIQLSTTADKDTMGKYSITISYNTENPNYTVKCNEGVYTVAANSEALRANATGFSGTYDGLGHQISVSVTTVSGAAVPDATIYYSVGEELTATNYGTGATTSPVLVNAGDYTVYYYVESDSYQPISGSAKIAIAKKTATVKAKDASIVYGDAPASESEGYGVTESGFLGSDTLESLGVTVTYAIDYAQFGSAGKYAITPSGMAETANYAITYYAGELTVTKRSLTFSWPNDKFTFNNEKKMITAYPENTVNGDEDALTMLYASNAGTKNVHEATMVGTYTATVTGLGGTAAGNYEIIAGETTNSRTWTIEKGANSLTTVLAMADFTYNDTPSVPTATAAYGNERMKFLYSDSREGTYEETIPTNAGVYFVKAYVDGDENCEEFVSTAVSFTIEKRDVTVTVSDIFAKEGENPSTYLTGTELYAVQGGFKESDLDDEITLVTNALSVSPAGDYEIAAQVKFGTDDAGNSLGDNYNLTIVKGTYHILSADSNLTIKAEGVDTVYDAEEHGIAVSVTASKSSESEQGSDEGGEEGGSEGGEEGSGEGTGSGDDKNADEGVDALSDDPEESGNKPTTPDEPGEEPADANATVYYSSEKLTDTTKVDWSELDQTSPTRRTVGTSTVYYYIVDNDTQAVIASGSKNITIRKAALTVTANDHTIRKGENAANAGVSYEGFQGDDTEKTALTGEVGYSYTYTTSSPVGEYLITPSGLQASNYEITYKSGKLTVLSVQKAVTITGVTATNSVYNGTCVKGFSGTPTTNRGDVVSSFVYTYKDAKGNVLSGAPKNVGSYTVTISIPEDNESYKGSSEPIAFAITKATVTVKPDNIEVEEGKTPSGTISYNGLADGDSIDAFDGEVTFAYGEYSTDAKAGDTFTITASGTLTADNYEFTYSTGILTVVKAKITPVTPGGDGGSGDGGGTGGDGGSGSGGNGGSDNQGGGSDSGNDNDSDDDNNSTTPVTTPGADDGSNGSGGSNGTRGNGGNGSGSNGRGNHGTGGNGSGDDGTNGSGNGNGSDGSGSGAGNGNGSTGNGANGNATNGNGAGSQPVTKKGTGSTVNGLPSADKAKEKQLEDAVKKLQELVPGVQAGPYVKITVEPLTTDAAGNNGSSAGNGNDSGSGNGSGNGSGSGVNGNGDGSGNGNSSSNGSGSNGNGTTGNGSNGTGTGNGADAGNFSTLARITVEIPSDLQAEGRTFYLMAVDAEGNIIVLTNEATEDGVITVTGDPDMTYCIIFEGGDTPLASFLQDDGTVLNGEGEALMVGILTNYEEDCYWHYLMLLLLALGILEILMLRKNRKLQVSLTAADGVALVICLILGSCTWDVVILIVSVASYVALYGVEYKRKTG